ncbi:4'-phosphopantetheinyl transferase superfamily protein [Streptomyces sp. NBC_01511]|uniref:4'-phosphopantetheinyl transferase family protein n=1 Tax=Streptomyces sp. NBC_01511 TaxID=2903889 RepID=UPI003867F136
MNEADLALLSPGELTRLRTLRGATGIHYAAAHASVRRVIARYVRTDAAHIEFGTATCVTCHSSAHGKPVIVRPDSTQLRFSHSRSGPFWSLAIATVDVGLDIEERRELDTQGVGDFALSTAERELLAELADRERQLAFFRCWTRKEAVVKASGHGLSASLRTVEVMTSTAPWARVDHASAVAPDGWVVGDLQVFPALSMALAYKARDADDPAAVERVAVFDEHGCGWPGPPTDWPQSALLG